MSICGSEARLHPVIVPWAFSIKATRALGTWWHAAGAFDGVTGGCFAGHMVMLLAKSR